MIAAAGPLVACGTIEEFASALAAREIAEKERASRALRG
jgi:hypothetical protein